MIYVVFGIASILLWLGCGWYSGWMVRRNFLKSHLPWRNSSEAIGRVFILLGSVAFLGVLVLTWLSKGKCKLTDHDFCRRYVSTNTIKHSWFGSWMPEFHDPTPVRLIYDPVTKIASRKKED